MIFGLKNSSPPVQFSGQLPARTIRGLAGCYTGGCPGGHSMTVTSGTAATRGVAPDPCALPGEREFDCPQCHRFHRVSMTRQELSWREFVNDPRVS